MSLCHDPFHDEFFSILPDYVEAVNELLNLIHNDIFTKTPRGQVRKGQDITWSRCKDIIKAKDKVLKIQEEGAYLVP